MKQQLIALLMFTVPAALAQEHDHSSHTAQENDMPMPMMMMMPMYFWQGTEVTYLFENIESKSSGGYVAGLFGTFALGLAVEFISYLRKYFHMRAQLSAINNSVITSQNSPIIDVKIGCGYRLLLTFIFMIMITGAFLLMLLVMTYNVGILFAAVSGLAVGLFMFNLVTLPELPGHYKFVEGKSSYNPKSEKCCNYVEDPRVSFARNSSGVVGTAPEPPN